MTSPRKPDGLPYPLVVEWYNKKYKKEGKPYYSDAAGYLKCRTCDRDWQEGHKCKELRNQSQ